MKYLYLTYNGVIKYSYVSKSTNADKFQDWATQILFIHQFGTQPQKTQLASNLLGVNLETVKRVFKASSTTVPCVYLFTLATVKELRESMNIDKSYNDDMIVCKYGKTDNLERRIGEHSSTYGSIQGVNLMLKYYSYIDPRHITEGENDIKNFMNAINAQLKYKNHEELIIVDQKMLNNTINKQYIAISKSYAGNITELLEKIRIAEEKVLSERKTNEINLLLKELEISNKDKELANKDNKICNLENELLRKEIELLKSKIK